jgi:hypothetical protein
MVLKPSLPRDVPSDDLVPPVIQGYISMRGKRSVFDPHNGKTEDKSTRAYHAESGARDEVPRTLDQLGFTVLAESPLGVAVAGPPEAFEELTGGRVETRERLVRAEGGKLRYITHLDIVGEGQPEPLGVGCPISAKKLPVDGVVLERPRPMMAVFPSPIPPNPARFHLRVPGDVVTLLSAHEAHHLGHRGHGVTVVMPDSGWYRHPYFTAHHYNVLQPKVSVPGVAPGKDPEGHGTGESANLLAMAPEIALQPIRASDNNGNLVGAVTGFMMAKQMKPRIITNSWGGDSPFPPPGLPSPDDRAVALEVRHAVEQGILVVFSAGNGHFSIEPQVPGVLAAGGVFVSDTLDLQASTYASGYTSPWFQGVTVPTVSGLVGLLPRAQYIMLPIPAGCAIDVDQSQTANNDPTTDGTASNDGWALFSGTSAAAPQVAGAAALVLSARPALKPAQVIESLARTAIDVTAGRCHPRFNNPARVGPDNATGAGLVNASAAVKYALLHF